MPRIPDILQHETRGQCIVPMQYQPAHRQNPNTYPRPPSRNTTQFIQNFCPSTRPTYFIVTDIYIALDPSTGIARRKLPTILRFRDPARVLP